MAVPQKSTFCSAVWHSVWYVAACRGKLPRFVDGYQQTDRYRSSAEGAGSPCGTSRCLRITHIGQTPSNLVVLWVRLLGDLFCSLHICAASPHGDILLEFS